MILQNLIERESPIVLIHACLLCFTLKIYSNLLILYNNLSDNQWRAATIPARTRVMTGKTLVTKITGGRGIFGTHYH